MVRRPEVEISEDLQVTMLLVDLENRQRIVCGEIEPLLKFFRVSIRGAGFGLSMLFKTAAAAVERDEI